MALTAQETRQVLTSARQLTLDAPAERVEVFISRVLGLNPIQQAAYFPGPDPKGLLALAIADLTGKREGILRDEGAIPSFAVYEDNLGIFHVAGLATYLESTGFDAAFRGRLSQHEQIRGALRRLRQGQDLEALAAAIMKEHYGQGEATRGSRDQGIDAIGSKELMRIDPSFSDGSIAIPQALPGETVFLFASSKAVIGAGRGRPKLLNPAHIRELVGGWVIQRSARGIWQKRGIRMLTPVQMILVTTYRLSPDAKGDCRDLGVQVWGVPELIYLVCLTAPQIVFDAKNGYAFSATAFRSWWKERHRARIAPTDL
jgi:hypothetical protein